MSKHVYLVTGGAGFVGANLCRRLIEEGEEVHVFVRGTTDTWRLEGILDRLRLHEVDICDADRVSEVVADIKPTVIYHLATHGAYHYQKDADRILLTNVFGLWNLFHACGRQGYELFINTGSSSEYGHKQFAMRESDMLQPDSYYAVAKAAQSLLGRHISQMEDLPIVTLRLFSVYGPYEEKTRLMPHVMMAILENRPLHMTNPDTARDFVYVDDVVDVYRRVDELKKLRKEILNVGTGVQNSLAEVVATAEDIAGHPLDVRWGEVPSRSWDSDVWVADASKLRSLTGCYPRTTLRDGLARARRWFAEFREHYPPDQETC